jgi:hypothetical protein
MLKNIKTPKEAYFYAKKIKERTPELESLIVRPYNLSLRKFVSKKEDHCNTMFMYAIAYERNILKRSAKIVKDEYRKSLEKQLMKHFQPYSLCCYASLIGTRLPDELHSRMTMESFASEDVWIKGYFEQFGNPTPEKFEGAALSKPKEIFNYLLDHPDATTEQIILDLWKRGIKVTKSLITRTKNDLLKTRT